MELNYLMPQSGTGKNRDASVSLVMYETPRRYMGDIIIRHRWNHIRAPSLDEDRPARALANGVGRTALVVALESQRGLHPAAGRRAVSHSSR
jgi:hypothetical protein